jgi:hypothetical protein
VRLYSADSDTPGKVDFRMQGRNALFTVPKLNAYCVVAVSW